MLYFRLIVTAWLTAIGASALPANALEADRRQPIVIEADRPGSLDLERRIVVFNGNVRVQQGSMVIRAERVEVRELPDGQRLAVATGSATAPASYRQERDVAGEVVEGSADRIEYDGRTGTLLLTGHGAIRRLRDGKVVDEITGARIRWDDHTSVFSVDGGGAGAPESRVRAVLTPPAAASAPASAPASGATR